MLKVKIAEHIGDTRTEREKLAARIMSEGMAENRRRTREAEKAEQAQRRTLLIAFYRQAERSGYFSAEDWRHQK